MPTRSAISTLGLSVALSALGVGGCTEVRRITVETTSPAEPAAVGVPGTCEAGTRPSLPTGACEPVGTRACAAGFEAAETGWGCKPILPAPCTGETRAVLGQSQCVPVDDCARAFPPEGADVVVHDDASLKSALATVKNGGTIALDTGTYSAIEVPKRLRDVHLIGRCAAKAIVEGTDRGLYVAEKNVTLESLTFAGFAAAIVAAWGSTVTASRIVVRDSQVAFVAGGDGAKLTVQESVAELTRRLRDDAAGLALGAQESGTIVLESSDVRGYPKFTEAEAAGTSIVVRHSTMTDLAADRSDYRVRALAGSEILFDESAVRFTSGLFAAVARSASNAPGKDGTAAGKLRLVHSTVNHSGDEIETALSQVSDGGRVALDGTTLEHRSLFAWAVHDAGSTMSVKDSVIRSAMKTNTLRGAVWVDAGGTTELDGTAIVNAQQHALLVTRGGARLTLTRSLVQETLPGHSATNPSFGALGVALAVASNATALVEDSALVSSSNYNVLAAGNVQVDIHRSIIDATSRAPNLKGGNGIGAFLGTRLVMDESLVRGSACSALVFADPNSEGLVTRTHFVDNPFGIFISEVQIVEATDDTQPSTQGQLVMFENVFEGTETMVHEGPVENPLPVALDP